MLIISGAVQAIGLIGARHVPHYWPQLILIVLAILIGVLLLRQPESGLLIMTLLLIALTIRPFPSWGWVFASGLVGIVLGVYLLMNGQRRMGARRAARHPAYLRGRGARLSRLAGAWRLRLNL